MTGPAPLRCLDSVNRVWRGIGRDLNHPPPAALDQFAAFRVAD